MLSSRPYLVRAIHEWIVDSGLTPHLLVDADQPGLEVPPSSIQEGRVVLNVSPTAVRDLLIDAEMVTFVARFGGVSQAVTVPMPAIEAVYARENGRGMMFPVDEDDENGSQEQGDADSGDGEKRDRKSKPNLKVVK
ncbi:MAG: ClpXP protease specificity-enhancing factor [Gammaproteobacteria bacterium]|nr:ClpXP protease specificity-enhancing factor [Gammaproteobacteria bacterium]